MNEEYMRFDPATDKYKGFAKDARQFIGANAIFGEVLAVDSEFPLERSMPGSHGDPLTARLGSMSIEDRFIAHEKQVSTSFGY